MIDRRALLPMIFTCAVSLAGCAGSPDAGQGAGSGAGQASIVEDGPQMLFISPMGEPFRAKPPAAYPVEAWFKGADKDGDGKLDLGEFEADAERAFHVLDVNKDGVIDHREIYYYEHVTVPEVLGQQYGALRNSGGEARLRNVSYLQLAQFTPGGLGDPSGPPVYNNRDATHAPLGTAPGAHDGPLVGAAAYGLLADPEPVQGSDIRLTGTITLADFKTRAEQRFQILDVGNKGYLTLATLPQTDAQRLSARYRRWHGPGRPV